MNFYFIRAASRNWRVMCSASVSMWHCGLVFSGCMHSLPSSSLRSFLWFFSSMIRLCHHNLGCTSKFKHPQKINWNCINSKFLLTAFVLKSVLSDMSIASFPGGSEGKASACNAGDPGSILGSRRCPGEGNSNPLWYSCLENPMDRGVW